MKVQVGQRVDIPCIAQGSPLPVITWFKGGSTVLVDGGQPVSNLDGSLSIPQAMLSDAGVYTCVATNIAGSDETEITLHVQGDFWHREMYGSGAGSGGNPWSLCKIVLGGLGSLSEDFWVTFMTPFVNFERRTFLERKKSVLLLNPHPLFLYVAFWKWNYCR